MKYLRNFNESIIPNTVLNNRGSTEISPSKFEQLLNTQCKNYSDDNIKIFRGQRDMGDYIYFDPTQGEKRKSIEKENIHVDLIDTLPSWKDYPKYSRSVIGLTSDSNVGAYGTEYEVIPFDNSKVVICPSVDIWSSFGSEGWGSDIKITDRLFKELFSLEETDSITKKHIDLLKNNNQNISSIMDDSPLLRKIEKLIERDSMNDNFYKPCDNNRNWKGKDDIQFSDIYHWLNDCLFNPEVRGFSSTIYKETFTPPFTKSSDFKLKNRQVWTSGPVIMRKI